MSENDRRLETGPGFVRARECPDCGHTRCSEDCVCNCDAARAEYEAAHLRAKVARLERELEDMRKWKDDWERRAHEWGRERDEALRLAYIGEHRFPDLSWKARCEEVLRDKDTACDAALEEAADSMALSARAASGFKHQDRADAFTEAADIIRALKSKPGEPTIPAARVREALSRARVGYPAVGFVFDALEKALGLPPGGGES